jgi:hypothetical protein
MSVSRPESNHRRKEAKLRAFWLIAIPARGTSVPAHKFGAERPRAASDLRGDLFQADDAGERAHFLLLILAQLKQ